MQTRFRTLIYCLLLLVLTLHRSADAQTPVNNEFWAIIQEDSSALAYFVRHSNFDSLESYYSSLPTHDIAEKIVYASRMYSLGGGSKYEDMLLASMPANDLELSYIAQLLDGVTQDSATNQRLAEIVSNLSDVESRLVYQHREYLQSFFTFGYVASGNGYLGEIFADDIVWLLQKDCAWFFNNLQRANPAVEQSVLQGFHVSAPSRTWIKTHEREIPKKYLEYFEDLDESVKGSG